ncbi:DUF4362 domain-containing protein [Paenibacillus glycanilyticus]|uniref:DUF4362 domain-containing protein n=1 Tax=Paenibacillus glycanilyticus TaxID=126569 RepID=A0ABQ6GCW0_9BACL|nr:DUF4362 domain-containing protein [Paenibacillus glycanilyticus]GLX67915.1 hypothetical protein MU1_22600 [Paenibacillus glycanilyticus]
MKVRMIFGVMAGMIVVLAALLIISVYPSKPAQNDGTILYRFDKKDIRRVNEMVERHNEGKGDYLMLIPPVIDGGFWIYDVHSDGKKITWTIDNSRDGMSGERGKTVYSCKNISMQEDRDSYRYTLHQCDDQGDKDIPIFSIPKEW